VLRDLERRVVLAVLDRKWQDHLYEMDYLQEGIGLRAYSQRDPLIEFQREGFEMFNAMLDAIREESVGYLFNLKVDVQDNPIVEETPVDAVDEAEVAPGARPRGAGRGRAVPAGAPAAGGGTAGGGRAGGGRAGRGAAGGGAAGSGAAGGGAVGSGAGLPPGLAKPKRPARLEYSAPTIDGAADGVERRVDSASGGGEFGRVGRNEPCPCGSGRKYKRCHGDPRTRASLT